MNRRYFLKQLALLSGLSLQGPLIPSVYARERPGSLVLIYLKGGYNALFSSADSFVGKGSFGVSESNVLELGGELVVDQSFASLGEKVLSQMATVGIRHNRTGHPGAQMHHFQDDQEGFYPLRLAQALDGSGPFSAVNIGKERPTPRPMRLFDSKVAIQNIFDVDPVLAAYQSQHRSIMAKNLERARSLSKEDLIRHAEQLVSLSEGYEAFEKLLNESSRELGWEGIKEDYQVKTTAIGQDLNSKLAAAELMLNVGSKVIMVTDTGWDTHGDREGIRARNRMKERILPALKTFLNRLESRDQKVMVAITGDFARSLPKSDHASVTSATVMGPMVRNATSGRVSEKVTLPEDTPDRQGFWALVGEALGAEDAFIEQLKGNPHRRLLKT